MHQPFRISAFTKLGYGVALAGSLGMGVTNLLRALGRVPGRPDIFDFHVFHLVGTLVWSGRLTEAYRMATLLPMEKALSGHEGFMPWSYPPLFALVLAPFGAVPIAPAFLVFVVATLACYVALVRRLGGVYAWPVLLAVSPAILINVQSGQNGLLTGSLVAGAALWLLGRRSVKAGLCVAALAIKPHLAVMLPIALALERRWLALGVAAAGALALTALSVAVLGTAVFSAFLSSFSEVRQFMALGAYPIHRMTTLYTCLLSFGLSSPTAIALHALASVAVLVWTAAVVLRNQDLRTRIGLIVLATIFVSPYLYDYDQTILGVGLALVAPALVATMSARGYGLLLAAIAASLTLGVVANTFYDVSMVSHLSLAAPVLLGCYALILRAVAARQPAHMAASFAAGGRRVGA